jgi:hypothetical protein
MNIEKDIAAMRKELRLLTELVKKVIGTPAEQKKYVFVETTYPGDGKYSRYLQFPHERSNIYTANILGCMAFHNGEATHFTSKEEARKAYSKCNGELNYPKFVLEEVYDDMCGLFSTKSITD